MNRHFCLLSRKLKEYNKIAPYLQKYLFVGQKHCETRILTSDHLKIFSELSGDTNPIHFDSKFVGEQTRYDRPLVHGALLNSLVSSVIGTKLPGPGSVVVQQELNFPSPCYVGEEILIEVTVQKIRKIITVDFTCKSLEQVVLHGYAKLVHRKS
ncbi:UNVERIFIED_CONTAM: hypothetical protein GTU68_066009 [Idotea baltica]|nr:hypothetical protein [Idotea baltica]